MVKFLWMASDCYATTARGEIFIDRNFVGATKTTKILVLKDFRLYGNYAHFFNSTLSL